jgi:hypothetical protein
MLGLQEGDAHVIRNAGGVITDDEIRSLAISQRLLGTTEIVLIHHADPRDTKLQRPAGALRVEPRRGPADRDLLA